jgi:phosphoribosylformylglycinamidine synthase subunit PurS
MFKAKVYVTLKAGVLDPQGHAVLQSLHSLRFEEVQDVRIGKFMEVELEVKSKEEARSRMTDMCERLLANPVIEDYTFELIQTDQATDRVTEGSR